MEGSEEEGIVWTGDRRTRTKAWRRKELGEQPQAIGQHELGKKKSLSSEEVGHHPPPFLSLLPVWFTMAGLLTTHLVTSPPSKTRASRGLLSQKREGFWGSQTWP
jgi:hypothetical protein